jgi:hypothetical protein
MTLAALSWPLTFAFAFALTFAYITMLILIGYKIPFF